MPDRGTVGCLTFLYVMAGLFFVAAWFGPPEGAFGNWHGLRAQFYSDLVRTTGTVLRYRHIGTSSSQMSRPVVEFYVDGRRHEFYGEGSNLEQADVGEQVPIAYRRSDPSVVYIRTFSEQFGVPGILMILELPFLALAVAGTVNARHKPM